MYSCQAFLKVYCGGFLLPASWVLILFVRRRRPCTWNQLQFGVSDHLPWFCFNAFTCCCWSRRYTPCAGFSRCLTGNRCHLWTVGILLQMDFLLCWPFLRVLPLSSPGRRRGLQTHMSYTNCGADYPVLPFIWMPRWWLVCVFAIIPILLRGYRVTRFRCCYGSGYGIYPTSIVGRPTYSIFFMKIMFGVMILLAHLLGEEGWLYRPLLRS